MPGSPYLEETPKGLLTWQTFSKQMFVFTLVVVVLGMYFDSLLYVLIALIVVGALRYFVST
jgi:hypothetical protein|tara:strand:+ start:373 stop:555 length:183 start_codon:yes stop_codon:yes gene_type:complete